MIDVKDTLQALLEEADLYREKLENAERELADGGQGSRKPAKQGLSAGRVARGSKRPGPAPRSAERPARHSPS